MSRRSTSRQPAVPALTARQIARMDRDADAFLLAADAADLAERVKEQARRGNITTPATLLKNDRKREDHGRGVAIAPKDHRGQAMKPDASCTDPFITVADDQLAECFRSKQSAKTWGDIEWADQSGLGQDPADLLEEIEDYERAGGDAAAKAAAAAEAAKAERLKKDAIGLLHPRDQPRVRQFLMGVPVIAIAAAEGCTLSCIYEALARSERRIATLLEYRRQCKIWAIVGGERPDLPIDDDGFEPQPEQLDLFAMSGEDEGVQQ